MPRSSAVWFPGKPPKRSSNTCPSKAIQTNRYTCLLPVRTYCAPSDPCATFNCVEVLMADNVGSKVSYFLVGLGVGALMGVLFAPKSGEETRDYLAKRAEDGREFAQQKARELRERADELIERGKDVASRKRESISAAVEAGREAFLRESKS